MHKKSNNKVKYILSDMGRKHRLTEIFSSLKEHRNKYYRDKTIIFSKYPVLFIMSRLLDFVKVPQNPYKMDNLIRLFKQYDFNTQKPLFSVEDLFTEGWLIKYIDEWYFNGWKNDINDILKTNDARTSQIIAFLKDLTRLEYKSKIKLIVNTNNKQFSDFLNKIDINVSVLVDMGIINENNSGYYIDPSSDIWLDWSSQVLSEKLNQWVSDGMQDAYMRWGDVFAYFHHYSMVEIGLNHIDEFFNMCLDYLEGENSTWQDISAVLNKHYQLTKKNILKNFDTAIPENSKGRFDCLHNNDELHIIFDNELKSYKLFALCVTNYSNLSRNQQQRFCILLKKPLYNLYYFHLHFQENDCTVDCLFEIDLFYDAAITLWNSIMDALDKGTISDIRLMEFVNELWNIIRTDLISSGEVYRNRDIVDFFTFVLQYEERKRKHVQSSNTSCSIFNRLVELYDKDVPYGTDAEKGLLSYISNLIESTHDYICTYYLYILIRLADSYSYDKSEYAREIYGIAFEGLLKWFENASQYNLILSAHPYDFFDIDIWKNIFEKNSQKAASFFYLYIKNIVPVLRLSDQSKGAAFGRVGRLSVIYLYLCTIWLKELKNDLSKNEYAEMELKWIGYFFELHERYELFSGEHIRMLQSEFAITRFMDTVSGFTDKGVKWFTNKLKRINAGDLVFWLGYVEHLNLRDEFLNVLAEKDVESLINNICFLPTEIQLLNILADICWVLSSQKRYENAANKTHIFIQMLKYVLADIRSTIKKKPYLENEYKKWIDSMQHVVLILDGQEDEILKGDSNFYKGLVYLHSNKIEELKFAVEIYEEYYKQGICTGSVNYIIALSLLIIRLHEEGIDYEKEITLLEDAAFYLLDNIQELNEGDASELYYYLLLAYFQIEDKNSFFNLMKKCPKKFAIKFDIAIIIIRQYVKDGKKIKAQSLLEKLQKKYGKNEYFDDLKIMIAHDDIGVQTSVSLKKPYTKSLGERLDVVSEIKSTLRSIYNLGIEKVAEVFTDEYIEPNVFDLYKTKEFDGFVVVHLLSLLFTSIKWLEEYRHFMTIEGGKTRDEDTYNATLTRFFNMIVPNCIGYEMIDQSQGGTTGNIHNNGELGKGERDIIIKRKSSEVMLLEGFKLSTCDKRIIETHISKIEGYNASDMSIVALPIYINTPNIKELWEKYILYLKELKENNKCNLTEIITEFDWKKVGLEVYPHMVCRTTHFYLKRDLKVHIYHIFINIVT